MIREPETQQQRGQRMRARAQARTAIAREEMKTKSTVLVDSWCAAIWLGVSIYSIQEWRSAAKQKKKGGGPDSHPAPTPIFGGGATSPVLYDAFELDILERIKAASTPAEAASARKELDVYKELKHLRAENDLADAREKLERERKRSARRLLDGTATAVDTQAVLAWGLDQEGAITGFMGLASDGATDYSNDEHGCFMGSLLNALRLDWADLDVRQTYVRALENAGRNELEELALLESEAKERLLEEKFSTDGLAEDRKPDYF
ncbi:MAG: hypothetical protein ACXIUZ_00545 [Lysobacteraceae bacterium]